MLSQDEDDDVQIVFDKNSESHGGNGVRPACQSNVEQKMEIRVLLCKYMVGQKVFTMEVPALCNELDIVTAIFSDSLVLRDNAGYKIRNGNIEQQAEVTHLNDRKRTFHYVINIQSVIEVAPSESTSPRSISSLETYVGGESLGRENFNQQEDEISHSYLNAKNNVCENLKAENDSFDIEEDQDIWYPRAEGDFYQDRSEGNVVDQFAISSQYEPVEEKPVVQDDDYNVGNGDIASRAMNIKSEWD